MRHFLAGLSCAAMMAVAPCGVSEALAAKASLRASPDPSEGIQVRYESQVRRTRIAAQPASDLCVLLTLPEEWRSVSGGFETHLKSALSDAALVVGLRASHELRGLPQTDIASRDAALLQQDYESLLGRPAQSVSLLPVSAGTTRWSATWIDAQLPSGPMTVEAFIVPLSAEWVLELSLSNVDTKDEHDTLVRSLLTGLQVRHSQGCGGEPSF